MASRTTLTAAFAVMLTSLAPVAYAQTATTAPAARASVSANHLMPGQIRVTQMDGATVYDTQNRNIGDIKDIILDRDGRVAAVILNVGEFLGVGGKFVAVPMNDVKVSMDQNNKPRFTVAMTKEQLKAAQAYDLNNTGATTGTSRPPANRNR